MTQLKLKLFRIAVGLCGTVAALISTDAVWDTLPITFGIPVLGTVLVVVSISFTAWGLGWFDEKEDNQP